MHTVYILAFATFAIVMAVGGWSYVSTRRNQKTGGNTSGLGGPNDPMV
jgi:TRAP-type C4-dicarboxylate transport system permease small subunit